MGDEPDDPDRHAGALPNVVTVGLRAAIPSELNAAGEIRCRAERCVNLRISKAEAK
eukprot:gene14852-17557_t